MEGIFKFVNSQMLSRATYFKLCK